MTELPEFRAENQALPSFSESEVIALPAPGTVTHHNTERIAPGVINLCFHHVLGILLTPCKAGGDLNRRGIIHVILIVYVNFPLR